jgi:hypothetical protein
MDTAAAVKKIIGKSDLYLAKDPDETVWATNKYWLVPATRVEPLLSKFNLDANQPGRYEVNGTVRKMSDDAPKMGHLVNLDAYSTTLETVKVDGQPAFIRPNGIDYLAVYAKPDGTHMLVNQEWLSWGLGDGNNKRVVTDGTRIGVIEYDTEKVKDSRYEDGKYVPAEYAEVNHRLVAVIMPARLPA